MTGIDEFRNEEIFIQHHYRPREGIPFYIVYCNKASCGVFTPDEVLKIAENNELKSIDEIKSFLLSQSSSRQEAQSHQEAVE